MAALHPSRPRPRKFTAATSCGDLKQEASLMCSTWILRYVIRRNSRAANNSVARAKSRAPHEIFRRFGLAEGDTFPPLPSACPTSQRYRSIGHLSRRATTLGTAEIARWHGAFLLSGRAACVLFDSALIGSGTAALLWVRSVSCRSTYGQTRSPPHLMPQRHGGGLADAMVCGVTEPMRERVDPRVGVM